MWKHNNCGGDALPAENLDSSYCAKCNHYIHDSSEVYLEHDIVNNQLIAA